MQGWREAAVQLEQKNARLLALNKVRLNPRLTFVTGEVMADSGSPFRRSAMVNVGRIDGVTDGSAALDGSGLVGRIAGVGERSSRIILLTDASSRVPAVVRPFGAARHRHRRQRPGAGARVHRPGRRAQARRPGGELGRRRALSAGHPDRAGGGRCRTGGSGWCWPPTTAGSTSCGWCARTSLAPIDGPVELIGPVLAADPAAVAPGGRGMSRPRALPPSSRRRSFVGLGVVAVQAALIPLGPGGALVAPDLLYGLVDRLGDPPPGERAALGGGGARALRRRDAVAAARARGARAGAGVGVVPAAGAALQRVALPARVAGGVARASR